MTDLKTPRPRTQGIELPESLQREALRAIKAQYPMNDHEHLIRDGALEIKTRQPEYWASGVASTLTYGEAFEAFIRQYQTARQRAPEDADVWKDEIEAREQARAAEKALAAADVEYVAAKTPENWERRRAAEDHARAFRDRAERLKRRAGDLDLRDRKADRDFLKQIESLADSLGLSIHEECGCDACC